MLVQGPTLHDAACIWITKYDGYTPPERFIIDYRYAGPQDWGKVKMIFELKPTEHLTSRA